MAKNLKSLRVNAVHIYGNLCADPELKVAGGASKASLRLAVNSGYFKGQGPSREWIEKTDFFNVIAWRETAERAMSLAKGDPVYVIGKLIQERWENNGEKRQNVLIEATSVQCNAFADGNKESGETLYGQDPVSTPPSSPVEYDDDLPF